MYLLWYMHVHDDIYTFTHSHIHTTFILHSCIHTVHSFDDHPIVMMNVLPGRLGTQTWVYTRPAPAHHTRTVPFCPVHSLNSLASTTSTQRHGSPHGRRPWATFLFGPRHLVYNRNKNEQNKHCKNKRQVSAWHVHKRHYGLKGLDFGF